LYSQEDIDKLRRVLRLTRELGVNLAGVEVILSMRAKMEQMQEAMEHLIQYVQQMEHQMEESHKDSRLSANALVKVAKREIVIKSD
jgi:MerR family transcriptional regulator/heat shock protein HspR